MELDHFFTLKQNYMKEEIKLIWIDALTSGEYQQGFGKLKTTYGRYCCLGVLYDLYLKMKNLEWEAPRGEFTRLGLLPISVCEWAGLPTEAVLFDTQESLAKINDAGTPFTKIAEIIYERY